MSWKAGNLYPCNPATARSESTKLGVDPKGEKLIYTNGRAVIIRDLNNPALAHAYTQHTTSATVARFSPSGFYVASGDAQGNVRIWDTTNPAENVLKLAIRPLGGRINDLAWDGESKRLIVGGEGKDKFGAAFFIETGSTCGEISGHAKPINCLSVRHQRPFRAVTGSDDTSVILHTAVPFKYDKLIQTHTRFVRDVGFSPNGDLFASVGSDAKLFFYDGKTGEVKAEAVGSDAQRSLMALSWSPDSTKLATAGADGVVAIWDVASSKIAQSYALGSEVEQQQNGVVYANNNTVVSVSGSGNLNVFDTRESSAKWRTLYGPTKAITASAPAGSGDNQTFYTGSFDGSMKAFAIGSSYGDREGECANVSGTGHTSRVVGLASDGKDKVYSTAWDDKIASIVGDQFTPASAPTKAQPTGIAATPSAVYVSSAEGLEIVPSGGGPETTHPGAATAVAAHASATGDIVAIGVGAKKVQIGAVAGGQVAILAEFEDNKAEVLSLAFSPDGSLLAAGDAAGRIVLIDVKEKKVLVSSRWTFHTGRIAQVAFSPSGRRIVSAGADESIYIWSVDKIIRNVAIKNAHPGGVAGVYWQTETKIVSAGADACVRTWEVPE